MVRIMKRPEAIAQRHNMSRDSSARVKTATIPARGTTVADLGDETSTKLFDSFQRPCLTARSVFLTLVWVNDWLPHWSVRDLLLEFAMAMDSTACPRRQKYKVDLGTGEHPLHKRLDVVQDRDITVADFQQALRQLSHADATITQRHCLFAVKTDDGMRVIPSADCKEAAEDFGIPIGEKTEPCFVVLRGECGLLVANQVGRWQTCFWLKNCSRSYLLLSVAPHTPCCERLPSCLLVLSFRVMLL